MKKLIILSLVLNSMLAFAQDNQYIDIVLDGKPAKMNTKTGETSFVNGKSTVSYSPSKNNIETANNHIVAKGETLYSISKKYGVSMAQIKSVNNLETDGLSIGQSLKTGYSNTSVISNDAFWTVKKGETLYAISKKSGVTVATLKTLNGLENNILSIGQKLRLR